jgi:hypothetical protein
MNTIKAWIDESDVYLLILGGRYGSVDPKTGKSYIEMEYEYALEKRKPLFAIVIEGNYLEKRIRHDGSKVFETENPQKLREFREKVLSKMVRFWSDSRDIKVAILETLADFSRRDNLLGWIPGNESAHAATLTDEIARLAKENANLRKQLEELQGTPIVTTYNGLTFDEIYLVLAQRKIDVPAITKDQVEVYQEATKMLGLPEPTLLHFLWVERHRLASGINTKPSDELNELFSIGLVNRDILTGVGVAASFYKLNDLGKNFLLRLRLKFSSV